MRKRLLAALLVVLMFVSLLPTSAFAADEGDYAAKIGDTEYATLSAALNKANSGDTIVLNKDLSWPKSQLNVFGSKTGRTYTIDLNGHTMEMGQVILVSGKNNVLNIEDSVGTGKVISAAKAFKATNGAVVNLYGGSYEYKGGLADVNGNGSGVYVHGGTYCLNVTNFIGDAEYGVKANNEFTYYDSWDGALGAVSKGASAVLFTAGATNAKINDPVTVTFEAGYDGGKNTVLTVAKDSSIYLLEAPVRSGYEFKGWEDASGDIHNPGDVLVVNAEMSFTAQWEGLPATITYTDFEKYGTADAVTSVNVKNGDTYYTIDNAGEKAHTVNGDVTLSTSGSAGDLLLGWQAGLTGAGEYTFTARFASNVNVSATCNSQKALTIGAANGGTETTHTGDDVLDISVAGDSVTATLRSGVDVGTYNEVVIVKGADGAFVTAYNVTVNVLGAEQQLSIASELTLTAGETAYNKVEGAADGAVITYESNNPAVATVDNDGKVTAVAEGTATITVKVSAAGNYAAAELSYTVNVNAATVTITFNTNGGKFANGAEGFTTDPIKVGSTYEAAEEPTRDGYTFTGWVDQNNRAWTSGSAVTETLVLTAQWTKNVYTVQFDPNGGLLNGTTESTTVNVEFGGIAVVKPTDPEREGFIFAGWYLGDDKWDFSDPVDHSMTLTALWVAARFTVTFDANGGQFANGTEITSTTVDYNQVIATVETPTYEGRTFAGWLDQDGNPWAVGTPVTRTLTLTAQWDVNYYTVQFDPDGGNWDGSTASQVVEVTYGTIANVKPADPVKEGYIFLGWYQNDQLWNFNNDKVTEDITLTAKWENATFTLTFDAKGGFFDADDTQPTATAVVNYGATYTPTTPERDGYTFQGWVTSEGEAWIPGETPVYANAVISAVWERITVTLTFYGNDGTIDGASSTTLTVYWGEKPTEDELPIPEREGYTFTGWYYPGGNKLDVKTSAGFTSSATFYAHWDINVYTVTFKANGGAFDTVGTDIYTVKVEHGDKVGEIINPTWDNHVFTGWLDQNLDSWDPEIDVVTSDVEVTAQWDVEYFNVTFNYADGRDPVTKTVKSGTKVEPVAQPERAGYVFSGWYVDGTADSFDFNIPITDNLNLTASWTIRNYFVTFDAVGGTINGEEKIAVTVAYGGTVENPVATPLKEGYNFSGWYTADGQPWVATTTITDNITVFAHWNSATYKVEFDANGGTPTPAAQYLDYKATVDKPADPEMEGYTFEGWYCNDTAWDFSAGVSSNMTLVARWAKSEYTIGFEAGNGTIPDVGDSQSFTVKYGDTVAAPVDPVWEGHTFTGWFDADGNQFVASAPVTASNIYYAAWEANVYTLTVYGNGGTFSSGGNSMTYYSSETTPVGNVEIPTRSGYDFTGWYWEQECTTKYDLSTSTKLTENLVLYAGWEEASYTVTYVGMNVTGKQENVAYGTMLNQPTGYEVVGYALVGWYTTSDYAEGTEWKFAEDKVMGDTALYAKYEANSYTLTLDANGGTFSDGSTVLYFTGSETEPVGAVPTPSREGYKFTGWYWEDGVTLFELTTETTLTKNTYLKAGWNVADCNVTFVGADVNGVTYTVKYGSKITAPTDMDVVGSVIEGWYTEADGAGTKWNFAADTVTSDIVLYANYVTAVYTVYFDANKGVLDGADTVEVAHGDIITGAPNASREGYTFVGWTYNGELWNLSIDTVGGDMTLTAKWSQVKHDVTFVNEDVIYSNLEIADGGLVAPKPEDPAKEGAAFTGWFYDTDGDGVADTQWQFAIGKVYADLTLYAMYDVEMYTVTYTAYENIENSKLSLPYGTVIIVNPNGGTYNGKTSSTQFTVTEDIDIANAEWAGHTFRGWNVTDVEGVKVFTADWNSTLFPLTFWKYDRNGEPGWDTSTYKFAIGDQIAYNVNGGTYNGTTGKNFIEVTLDNCNTLTLDSSATRPGYSFNGWNYNATADTFVAQWKEVFYTVSYNEYLDGATPMPANEEFPADTVITIAPNGGSYDGSTSPVTLTLTKNETLIDPVWEGHEFLGWLFDGDHTFTAMWSTSDYAFSYYKYNEDGGAPYTDSSSLRFPYGFQFNVNVNGGTYFGKSGTFVGTVDETEGSRTLDGSATRAGYTFLGWRFDGVNTFTAMWSSITFTVTFDPNGGEGSMDPQVFTANVKQVLNANTFTYAHHIFTGWNTQADGQGQAFSDKQAITFFESDEDITLYAQWVDTEYNFKYWKYTGEDQQPAWDTTLNFHNGDTIYIDPNGGVYGGMTDRYYSVISDAENTRVLDQNATRDGYAFLGWEFGIVNGYGTFTAQWGVRTYTATFMDGENKLYTEQYNHGDYIEVPVEGYDYNPPEGMTLEGWYTQPDFGAGTKWNFDTMTVSSDITLYAKFETTVFKVTFHGNGGYAAGGSETYVSEVDYKFGVAPPVDYFSRDGYLFLGWSNQPNTELVYDADTSYITVAGSADFYAVWAKVLDWGQLEYSTVSYSAKKVEYNANITGCDSSSYFTRSGLNKGTVLTIRPKNLEPSNTPYEYLYTVTLANGETHYVLARYQIVAQIITIATDVDNAKSYVVADAQYDWTGNEAVGQYVKVYVTAAMNQNITISLENNNGVLEPVDPNNLVVEMPNTDGVSSTYVATYKVVSIPADRVTITFKAEDAFGTVVSIDQTMNLRTIVYAFIYEGDVETPVTNISGIALHHDYDSYDHPPLAMNYDTTYGCYVALADKANHYDYLRFQTDDGREVIIRTTTGEGGNETITYALTETTDGEVVIEYVFGAYTIVSNLYVNGNLMEKVDFTMTGNFGDQIDWDKLKAWANEEINERYPNTDMSKYDYRFTYAGTSEVVYLTYYGENDRWEWPANVIYIDVNATAGYNVAYFYNYDENGDGYTDDLYYTDFVLYGGTVTPPTNPTRDGYIFGGWYTEPECVNVYDFSVPMTSNSVNLYAKWTKDNYNVVFDNGYGGHFDYGTPWAPQQVEYGGLATQPTEAPTRDGYEFTGWFKNKECTETWDFATEPVLGYTVIYTGWKQIDYWVVYHLNSTLVENADLFENYVVHFGDTVTEPAEPVVNGYVFQGWYLDEELTVPAEFPISVTGQVDLYAKWAEAVTITFNLNGGKTADGSTENFTVVVAKGGPIPEPETPVHDLYVFAGWFTDSSKWDNPWNFDEYVAQEDLTLYAGWGNAELRGNFFNTTRTSTYVRLQVKDSSGNWIAASGIPDLMLSAVNNAGETLFSNVLMHEIRPGSAAWQDDWDTSYAYYTATYPALIGSGIFKLAAENYTFNTIA